MCGSLSVDAIMICGNCKAGYTGWLYCDLQRILVSLLLFPQLQGALIQICVGPVRSLQICRECMREPSRMCICRLIWTRWFERHLAIMEDSKFHWSLISVQMFKRLLY